MTIKYQILLINIVAQFFIFVTQSSAQSCGIGHYAAQADSIVLAKAIAGGLAPDEARRRMASQKTKRLNLLSNKEITVLVVTTKPSNLAHFDLQAAVKLLKSSTNDTSLCKIDFKQVNDTIIQNVWSASRNIFENWEDLKLLSRFSYDCRVEQI